VGTSGRRSPSPPDPCSPPPPPAEELGLAALVRVAKAVAAETGRA
jgi:hypothetical protein